MNLLPLILLLSAVQLAASQAWLRGVAGNCTLVEVNGDASVLIGLNCNSNLAHTHQSKILLDRCLSFQNSSLVTGQG